MALIILTGICARHEKCFDPAILKYLQLKFKKKLIQY